MMEVIRRLFVMISIFGASLGRSPDYLDATFVVKDQIVGNAAMRFGGVSKFECSSHCLLDTRCQAFQYRMNEQNSCIMIYENITQEGSVFTSHDQRRLYKKASFIGQSPSPQYSDVWSRPANWSSDDLPAFYLTFDHDKYIQLENGAQLVEGKVNKAVKINLTNTQWVNLGNLSSLTCFVIPKSCGAAGGALSAWIKILECPHDAGIISSYQSAMEGFLITCYHDDIRYAVSLESGTVFDAAEAPQEWYHLVFNFINPGIVVYHDGVEVVNTGSVQTFGISEGLGLVVIGRNKVLVDDPNKYPSLMMDELMFFNRKLNLEEVQILYQL